MKRNWFAALFGVCLAATGFATLFAQTPLQPYNPAPFGPGQSNAPVAGSVSPFPAYVANRWYSMSMSTMSAGAALSITSTYCQPYYVRQTFTTNSLGVNIGTLGVGTFQQALYSEVNGRPGNLLVSSTASIADTATGFMADAVPSTQIAGPADIWYCLQVSDATAIFISNAIASSFNSSLIGATAGVNAVASSGLNVSVTTPGTYGTWPASLAGSTWTDQVAARSPGAAVLVVSAP
jgi:hypothetical protein